MLVAQRVAASAIVGAAASWAAFRFLERSQGSSEAWNRTNHRGEPVSLLAGPAVALGASAGVLAGGAGTRLGPTGAVTGLSVGALGVYDDIVGAREDQKGSKGFKGHLGALRKGKITSGLIKIVGIGSVGMLAGAAVAPRPVPEHLVDVVVNGGLVAGMANFFNLLDLRPGRAIKAAILVGTPVLGTSGGPAAAATVGSGVAMLPSDLAEKTMLGDGGANAIGALLGLAVAEGTSRGTRAGTLAVLVVLTAASERISFTQVIESTPGLREVDALGRRPR